MPPISKQSEILSDVTFHSVQLHESRGVGLTVSLATEYVHCNPGAPTTSEMGHERPCK